MKAIQRKMAGGWEPGPNRQSAFTRIELLACVVGLALIWAVALPAVATTRAQSATARCFNNLRQIGRGVRLWAGDHSEDPPWLTLTSDGGTKPTAGSKPGNAWPDYLSLSNQLVTPRILACPSDSVVKVASEWNSGSNALAAIGFRGQAISYLLGLHANAVRPMALVAADYNMFMTGPESCGPARINDAFALRTTIGSPPPPEAIRWTNGPHLSAGHVAFVDGSVTFLDSDGLTAKLSSPNSTDNGVHHILQAH